MAKRDKKPKQKPVDYYDAAPWETSSAANPLSFLHFFKPGSKKKPYHVDVHTQFFEVPNFAKTKVKVGAFVDSPPFECDGKTWFMRVYHSGKTADSEGRVGLYVHLKEDANPVTRAEVSFVILRHGGAIGKLLCSGDELLFGPETLDRVSSPAHGRPKMITREQLLKPSRHFVSPTGAVTFAVTLQVRREPHDQLTDALAGALGSGLHSDVTLIVEGEEIRAHKVILAARSPVFKAMFAHKMSESLEGTAAIDDMPLAVFRELLRCASTLEVILTKLQIHLH